MGRIRGKFRKVRKRIAKYRYRKKNGKTVVVSSHFRTYKKRIMSRWEGERKGEKKPLLTTGAFIVGGSSLAVVVVK